MARFDLLIKGGETLIPATSFRGALDIGIAQGRIVEMAPSLSKEDASVTLTAAGKLVVPGLIDMHTHLGFEVHTHVVDPNTVCPPSGVTTAVDMGSTGAFTFPWYRRRVLEAAAIQLFEFLNIASLGVIAIHNPYYVEHYGDYVNVAETIRTVQEHHELIRGIKVFASSAMVGDSALMALRAARRVADIVGLPIAVHISEQPPALESILSYLVAGDIVTHSFTGHNQGILTEDGTIRPAVRDARDRGVLFDIGHGAGSFSFEVARRALAQGFEPDIISTDLYYANVETPVKDLLTTLSKFLCLGYPLDKTLGAATCIPARALCEPSLGTLEIGGPADIALLTLNEGTYTYLDSLGQPMKGQWKLGCEATVKNGRVIYRKEGA